METKDTKVIYCNEVMSEMAEFIKKVVPIIDWFDVLYYTERWQEVQASLDNDEPEIWGDKFFALKHEIDKLRNAFNSLTKEDLPKRFDPSVE